MTKNEVVYQCLIDPLDKRVVFQGEELMEGRYLLDCGNELIESWGSGQLPLMEEGETRTLDYYYATSRIRPHRSVATFTKGPFSTERRVTGSSEAGFAKDIPYVYGFDGCRPASYNEFPLPEKVPGYLSKQYFYDEKAIKLARAACVEELRSAVALGFGPESILSLLTRLEDLVGSTGGRGLHPHPVPFFGDSEEEGAVLLLDLALFAILNKSNHAGLPADVIRAHKERRERSDIHDHELRQLLASI
ncbi:hypothetical protein [Haloferula sp. A504]|uniref:hypothetical protein n=1 Tax=Haloferula sp. A504 TaxID=3373601 RepID=UPI0037C158C3